MNYYWFLTFKPHLLRFNQQISLKLQASCQQGDIFMTLISYVIAEWVSSSRDPVWLTSWCLIEPRLTCFLLFSGKTVNSASIYWWSGIYGCTLGVWASWGQQSERQTFNDIYSWHRRQLKTIITHAVELIFASVSRILCFVTVSLIFTLHLSSVCCPPTSCCTKLPRWIGSVSFAAAEQEQFDWAERKQTEL